MQASLKKEDKKNKQWGNFRCKACSKDEGERLRSDEVNTILKQVPNIDDQVAEGSSWGTVSRLGQCVNLFCLSIARGSRSYYPVKSLSSSALTPCEISSGISFWLELSKNWLSGNSKFHSLDVRTNVCVVVCVSLSKWFRWMCCP